MQINAGKPVKIATHMVDNLYQEAMSLADSARIYFDTDGVEERLEMDNRLRAVFSHESLKVTTRLMNVISWLLSYRVHQDLKGEVDSAARSSILPLGYSHSSDFSGDVAFLPQQVQELVVSSCSLYNRVQRLANLFEEQAAPEMENKQPVNKLLEKLRSAF